MRLQNVLDYKIKGDVTAITIKGQSSHGKGH